MSHNVDQFVADLVPDHSTLASALLEFAARQRGLDVERFDRSITLVQFPDALVPFVDLNGPDTTRMGELLCTYHDALRPLLADAGLAVVPSSTFLTTQPKGALGYAKELGWPVTVRPTRIGGDGGVTADIQNAEEFRAAWDLAGEALRKRQGFKRVMVERHVSGERLSFFVVGNDVVAVTLRDGTDVVDVTDETSGELTQAAVAVVDTIPGLAYAEVTLIVSDPSRLGAGAGADVAAGYVVDTVTCTGAPVAHAPTRGQVRDVAGAIVDWYLHSPRWPVPRQLSHTPAEGKVSAVEPLFQGRK